ncbi:uncharacterized protein M421DRAFT_331535 [Didymella exigua CBS 183.55]|uniref:BZIP domain-containing protein n=1 Tax=Didymella exigua CBS 183.55 TaxID=1150837 RepID=A0A6A5R6Z6_9PLEO|nr:uncharacterized protein M421DRAFT_331535 [Didymella exigua CBS 183.55]KAF1923129.1 hypothetical protein M421DRAFT_331535 [Didymella exigua CBS 183.55]
MNVSSRLHPGTPIVPRAQSTGAEPTLMQPRKVNSEVRKQQNRIASRNYREKRKRKLQQLQQLLEDDDPSELQTRTRSKSPYEDRSCSESVGYERSIASSSPHIATVLGNLESPHLDHTATANQTWSETPFIPSIEQPLRPVTCLQSLSYNMGTPTATSYPVWSTIPSVASTGYVTTDPAHQSMYSSRASIWPSFECFYSGSVHQQTNIPSTVSYATLWQHNTSEDVPAGIAIDPHGWRYYTYGPS